MTDQPDMRQVVLAYPRKINGKLHDPDSVVELPAQGLQGAKQLVREGRARWPEGTDQGRPSDEPQAAEPQAAEQAPAEVTTEQAPAPAAEQTPAPAATQEATPTKTTTKRARATGAGQDGE